MKRKIGSLFLAIGLLSLVAAGGLTAYNLYENHQAMTVADALVEQMEQLIEAEEGEQAGLEEAIPDYVLNPQMEMPTVTVKGHPCIGIVEIPALDRSLPVMSSWSYKKLKTAPCRYSGSAYTDDMIIAAHNYVSHFRKLAELSVGDEVIFTDADNNVFHYAVVEVEVLKPTAIEEMKAGEWDLTLFTCTLGGASRITVRCERLYYTTTA